MEKFDFDDLVLIARKLMPVYGNLVYEDSEFSLHTVDGKILHRDDPEYVPTLVSANLTYDEIKTLIHILQKLVMFRPLPF